MAELRALSARTWRFVEIDVPLHELQLHRPRIRSLIAPLDSVLDDSIGAAIWFAARGIGTVASGMGGTC